ncbi:phage holin family protein [Niallia circulans]|uniref:phage holin family protein n=1 Tax=Niallia circulans TaxID=1397 RepID=UPI001F3C9B99|nr:phage holin family protein [Niallia circulans]
MELELLKAYINENYYIFIPVLWVIGYALKQTPMIPNWLIIWILLAFSIILGTWSNGFHLSAIINGILVTGVAVLGHQMMAHWPFKK